MTLKEMMERAANESKEKADEAFAETAAKARAKNEARAAVWAVTRHELLKMVGPALVEDQPLPVARTTSEYGKPFCICQLTAVLTGVEDMWFSTGSVNDAVFAERPAASVKYIAPLAMSLIKSLQEKGVLETGCGVWPDGDSRYWWEDFNKNRPDGPIPITQFVTGLIATGRAALTQSAMEQMIGQLMKGGQKPKCGW
jgi:hypothetical protein